MITEMKLTINTFANFTNVLRRWAKGGCRGEFTQSRVMATVKRKRTQERAYDTQGKIRSRSSEFVQGT